MDEYSVVKYPVTTEKAVRLMQTENKLVFIVDRKSTKSQIKQALEKMLTIKIDKVNTLITPKGKKKVYITVNKEKQAIDIASQLGFM
jgi:large subunit ribosomal protein L23